MSSSLATAQHLKKVELWWIDVPFLEACLPSLGHSPSLQELRVYSTASGECYVSEVTVLMSVCRVCVVLSSVWVCSTGVEWTFCNQTRRFIDRVDKLCLIFSCGVQVLERSWLITFCCCVALRRSPSVTLILYLFLKFWHKLPNTLCQGWQFLQSTTLNW